MENRDFAPFEKKKFDVSSMNITCAECGTSVTELPFEPKLREDGTYGRIYCTECNRSRFRDRKPFRGRRF